MKWVHATPRFALNWTESLAGVLGVVWGHHLWVPITSPGSPLQCEAPCGDLPLNARCLARERLREVAGYGEGSVVVVRCCAEHIYLTAGTQHHLVHHSHFFSSFPQTAATHSWRSSPFTPRRAAARTPPQGLLCRETLPAPTANARRPGGRQGREEEAALTPHGPRGLRL